VHQNGADWNLTLGLSAPGELQRPPHESLIKLSPTLHHGN
jgi:hypothetical protein